MSRVLPIAKGLATYIPGVYKIFGQRHMNIDGATPDYFYGVWFKHLSLLGRAGAASVPKRVAEFGPGDSLGTAVAALLSGVEHYSAVDVVPFAQRGPTAAVAQGVRALMEQRLGVVSDGVPEFGEFLDERGLPRFMPEEVVQKALAPERAEQVVREATTFAAAGGGRGKYLDYVVPFDDRAVEPGSIDFLISHAVLEHVVDMPEALRIMKIALKSGGVMSHQFDLRSHYIVPAWDGHRAYSQAAWKMVVGKRPFMINRLPYATILQMFKDAGFKILSDERIFDKPTLSRDELSAEWRDLPDEELRANGGYILAQKP